MKKAVILLLPFIFLISGCNQNKSTDSTRVKQTTTENTSSLESTATNNTKKNSTNDESTTTEENLTTKESTQSTTKAQSSPSTISSESTVETSQSAPDATNILAGYSDLQIEYARVWLATMGTHYKEWVTNPGFNLHVSKQPAGAPIDVYHQGSVAYPTETVTLSGDYGYQSLVVYSSNHNGTVTKYDVPSHWQDPQLAQDPEYARAQTQKILDSATILPIPVGNPEDVKQLIDVMVIDD